jgi:hypothetical protein
VNSRTPPNPSSRRQQERDHQVIEAGLCLVAALAHSLHFEYGYGADISLLGGPSKGRPTGNYSLRAHEFGRKSSTGLMLIRRNLERRTNSPRTMVFHSKPCAKRLNMGDLILRKSRLTSLAKKPLWRQAVSPQLSRSTSPGPRFFRQRNGLGCSLEPSR